MLFWGSHLLTVWHNVLFFWTHSRLSFAQKFERGSTIRGWQFVTFETWARTECEDFLRCQGKQKWTLESTSPREIYISCKWLYWGSHAQPRHGTVHNFLLTVGTAPTIPCSKSSVFFLCRASLYVPVQVFGCTNEIPQWGLPSNEVQNWGPSHRVFARGSQNNGRTVTGLNFCICWPSSDVMTQRVACCQSNVLDTGDTKRQPLPSPWIGWLPLIKTQALAFPPEVWKGVPPLNSPALSCKHMCTKSSRLHVKGWGAFVDSCGNDLFELRHNVLVFDAKKKSKILEISGLSHNCSMRLHRLAKNSCADNKQKKREYQLDPGPFISLCKILLLNRMCHAGSQNEQ